MPVRDFLLEIGSEELPSAPLDAARKQLLDLTAKGLADAGLAHGELRVLSSPRRLAVIASDVADATEAVSITARGPRASAAFDADGNPTKAALGFARSKGVEVEDLVVRDEKGQDYVFCDIERPSRPASELLGPMAESLIARLSWPRSQRWGSESVRYCRPVRWIVCLFGPEVVPVAYGDVTSGRETRGHRVLAPGWHDVADPASYEATLEAAFVLSHDVRAARIREGIEEVEGRLGVAVDTPARVFAEVVNLCEWPTVITGQFDERFLDVPQEIICESMLSHQRYFPTYDAKDGLTRTFVVVGNGDPACSRAIADGNERVVRARLDDAAFFYEEDLKASMEDWLERLEDVTFQERLGTLRQKVYRMEGLACEVARLAGEDDDTQALCGEAAHLAKADLVSSAVVEFTNQQGVMGGYYATAAGAPREVAEAIADHYRPRFAGDELPRGFVGKAVAIADKLDTICGMFAIDEPPTGSKDPFAQRRSAIGIIRMLLAMPQVPLRSLIAASLALYREQGLSFDEAAVAREVAGFMAGRLAVMARDEGASPDAVQAVSATGVIDPEEFLSRVRTLESMRSSEAELMDDLAQGFTRATHLADASLGTDVDEALLKDAERRLLRAVEVAEGSVAESLGKGRYGDALAALAKLRGPVDAFFEEVLVMDPDERIRANRLRLLNRFAAAFGPVADFRALARPVGD